MSNGGIVFYSTNNIIEQALVSVNAKSVGSIEITSYFFTQLLSLSQQDGTSSALVRFRPRATKNQNSLLFGLFSYMD
jgi:hypothetical protein